MIRLTSTALAAFVALAASAATAAPIYPLTNGPYGTEPNTLDSMRGWDGINSIAPERELLYEPQRSGSIAGYRAESPAGDGYAESEVAPLPRHPHHPRRHRIAR